MKRLVVLLLLAVLWTTEAFCVESTIITRTKAADIENFTSSVAEPKNLLLFNTLTAEDDKASVDAGAKETITLKLKAPDVVPAVTYIAGDTTKGIKPEVNLVWQGESSHIFYKKGTKDVKGKVGWGGEALLSFKGVPLSGTADDVSQAIRTDAGYVGFSGYASMAALKLWKDGNDYNAVGPELHLGFKGSYEKASATGLDPANPSALVDTEFLMFSPQAKLGFWAYIALLGYQYDYHFAQNKNSLTKSIDNTSSHKLYIIFPLPITAKTPLYLEVTYTGGKNEILKDGTATVSFTGQLNFF